MKLGAHIFLTDESIPIGVIARELEERDDFESLWLPEHTHIPTSRATAWPLEGEDIPRAYLRVIDPFVGLAAAAATTSELVLGTGICLVAQHDPIVLAKTVASLDLVSGGRFVFGAGLGWNIEEVSNHGVDPSVRRSVAREKVMAMQGLWREDAFGFRGDHVEFEEAWSWPKPPAGHPPVLMGGGGGRRAFQNIAEHADGWMPDMSFLPLDELGTKLGELRRAWEDHGRDPETLQVTTVACPPDPAVIDQLDGLGVQRCVFVLPSADTSEVLRALDDITSSIAAAASVEASS